MPKGMIRTITRKPKMRKMEPLEPLPTKDDYANEIDAELAKYEENLPEIKDQYGVGADQSDMNEMNAMSKMDYIEPNLSEPLPYEEYIGPEAESKDVRRKRLQEQIQTEKDATPMRVLRAAKEGFVEGAKEGVSNIKKAATAVAEGTGIPSAYRTARSAIKSVGKMAGETNRAKSSPVDPAVKELSDMMSAGVITEGDLARFRRAMQTKKGSME